MPKRKGRAEATAAARSPVVTAAVDIAQRKEKEKINAPRRKSPEQLQHWSQYVKDINSAKSGEEMLAATLRYEKADKAQASFAFNRAKKMLTRVNVLSDKKWEEKSYKSFGALKTEFYAVFSTLGLQYVPLLKHSLVTPTTSKGKLEILYGDKLTDHSSVAAPVIVDITPSSYSSNKRRNSSVAVGQKEGDMRPVVEGSAVCLPDTVEQEILRKIRCERLSEAISHPSFQLLTLSQRQTVTNKWVSLLRS